MNNDVEIIEDMKEPQTQALVTTNGGNMPVLAIAEAVARYKALEAFVTQVMEPGRDYGAIPGTDKPTLLKPGAEKLCTFFGLSSEHSIAGMVENWETGFFYYRYRCSIYRDGVCIAVAEGSCNSKEKKYRYRNVFANEATDEDKRLGTLSERTSKNGKPYKVYVIENREPFDLVNTLQKMAQKRAHVAATLIAVNASQFFTQDMEDMAQRVHDDTPASETLAGIEGTQKVKDADAYQSRETQTNGNGAAKPATQQAREKVQQQSRGGYDGKVSEKQIGRMFAIGRAKGWEDEEVRFLCAVQGFADHNQLTKKTYDAICDEILVDPSELENVRGAMMDQ